MEQLYIRKSTTSGRYGLFAYRPQKYTFTSFTKCTCPSCLSGNFHEVKTLEVIRTLQPLYMAQSMIFGLDEVTKFANNFFKGVPIIFQ